MEINSTALSLTVTDVEASSRFLKTHFKFQEKWSADGFAYLTHHGLNMPLIFLESGKDVLPEAIRNDKVSGVIVAFVVDELEVEYERLKNEGVTITEPIREDPWGERLFQVTDPNGVVIQLVQWVIPSDSQFTENHSGSQPW
ncbi:VOC family protein [Paenibacillus ehimensis]|uniref:VOC family protein n=1 Tax=Paenibacillus ehimensis TaxID=79264 RepID=A0ABT8V696_9BACL|nr:VOC family protein [Paenibacillus ehimensis]MDO3676958.1 VOC family protein [Paenibacillus ehimensis]